VRDKKVETVVTAINLNLQQKRKNFLWVKVVIGDEKCNLLR